MPIGYVSETALLPFVWHGKDYIFIPTRFGFVKITSTIKDTLIGNS